MGGWELCQPGRQRGQAWSIPLGRNGQCVWFQDCPSSSPPSQKQPLTLRACFLQLTSSLWPLTRAEFLLPKWGSLYSSVGSGRTSSLGLSPSFKGKQP